MIIYIYIDHEQIVDCFKNYFLYNQIYSREKIVTLPIRSLQTRVGIFTFILSLP